MSEPSPFTDHFATAPPAVRERLEALRAAIREEAPAAEECISYGIPTFDLHGKHLVHFAGYARHIGLYPGAKAMVTFAEEFAGYKTAKGSVQLPNDAPLPLDLVRRVVRFRLGEVAPSPRKKRA